MSTSTPENSSENPVVTGALTAIQNYQKEVDTGGKKRWIFALIGVILAVVAGALVYWKLWKQGKELAKLKHERDVSLENAEQLKVNAALEVNAEKKEELSLRIDVSRAEQLNLQNKIDLVEASAAQNRAILDRLQTWEDIDSFLKKE